MVVHISFEVIDMSGTNVEELVQEFTGINRAIVRYAA